MEQVNNFKKITSTCNSIRSKNISRENCRYSTKKINKKNELSSNHLKRFEYDNLEKPFLNSFQTNTFIFKPKDNKKNLNSIEKLQPSKSSSVTNKTNLKKNST